MGYLFTISLLTSIKQLIINNLKFIIMKKLFFFIAFLFATANSFSQVYVSGYTTNNGTYVSGYTRSSPTYSNTSYSTPSYSYSSYSTPSYSSSSSYSTPSYTTPSYCTYRSYTTPVYTGSRGGAYYVNSNGNKTYISK